MLVASPFTDYEKVMTHGGPPRIISEIPKRPEVKQPKETTVRPKISGDLLVICTNERRWWPRRVIIRGGQLLVGSAHCEGASPSIRLPLRHLSLRAGPLPNSLSLIKGTTIVLTIQTSSQRIFDLWVKTIAIELIKQTPLDAVKYLDILTLKDCWNRNYDDEPKDFNFNHYRQTSPEYCNSCREYEPACFLAKNNNTTTIITTRISRNGMGIGDTDDENSGDAVDGVVHNLDEDVNRKLDEGVNRNQDEDVNRNHDEDVNRNQDEGVNRNQDEGVNRNEDEGVNRNQDEDVNKNLDEDVNKNLDGDVNRNLKEEEKENSRNSKGTTLKGPKENRFYTNGFSSLGREKVRISYSTGCIRENYGDVNNVEKIDKREKTVINQKLRQDAKSRENGTKSRENGTKSPENTTKYQEDQKRATVNTEKYKTDCQRTTIYSSKDSMDKRPPVNPSNGFSRKPNADGPNVNGSFRRRCEEFQKLIENHQVDNPCVEDTKPSNRLKDSNTPKKNPGPKSLLQYKPISPKAPKSPKCVKCIEEKIYYDVNCNALRSATFGSTTFGSNTLGCTTLENNTSNESLNMDSSQDEADGNVVHTVEILFKKCQNVESYVPVREKLVLFESLSRLGRVRSTEDVSLKVNVGTKRARSLHDLSFISTGVREICKMFERKPEDGKKVCFVQNNRRIMCSDSQLNANCVTFNTNCVTFNRNLSGVSYA